MRCLSVNGRSCGRRNVFQTASLVIAAVAHRRVTVSTRWAANRYSYARGHGRRHGESGARSAGPSCCAWGSSGSWRRRRDSRWRHTRDVPGTRRPAAVAVVCERGIGDVAAAVTSALDRAGREVVVVLAVPDVHTLLDCIAAGAYGFVLEGDARMDLLAAVRAAARAGVLRRAVAAGAAAGLPPRRARRPRRRPRPAAPARGRTPHVGDRRAARHRAEDRAQPLVAPVPPPRRALAREGGRGRRTPRPAGQGLASLYRSRSARLTLSAGIVSEPCP